MFNKTELTMKEETTNLSSLVKIVCPSADELSVIVNNVRCNNCGLFFKNEPRLRLHDLKVHQHKNLVKTVKESVRYHCPELSCTYSPQSSRHFTTMKYLKQHYLKVHAAKRFPCTQCDKLFSTEAATIAHMRICGLEFTCTCLKKFNTYEALLTHAKRLSHCVDEKYKNLLKRTSPRIKSFAQIIQVVSQKKPVSILPHKDRSPSHQQPPKNTCNAETQTDDIKRPKKALSPSKSSRRRESRQTQTNILSRDKKTRKTTGTQTIPSLQLPQRSALAKKSRPLKRSLHLTEDFTNVNLFPSSPLNLQHDVGIQDFWEERNTLGTQTSPDKNFLDVFNNDSVTQTGFYPDGTIPSIFKSDISSSLHEKNYYQESSRISRSDPMLTEDTFNDRYSSIETQTEKPYPQSIFDTGSLLSSSNTETQTTEQFDNIEQLLYSNMCTQTCNDILSSELGLSDIQTQTAWQELEGNGDVQENDDKSDISIGACRSWLNIQTSHTETQTDLLSIFDELQ